MTLQQRFHDILSAADLLAAAIVHRMSPEDDRISQTQAHKKYGRRRVEQWVKAGLVKGVRSGSSANSKIMYSLFEIRAAIEAEREAYDAMRGLR
jgi:hypothetical protein